MRYSEKRTAAEGWYIPHIGQRIVKTTVAVFLCLLIYYLRGYHGQDMPTESAITAIICMQPYVRDTRNYALNRFAGSLIGAAWGLGLLLLLYAFPALGENMLCLYALMAFGVLLSLYSAVLFRVPDTSSLAAIVFLCIVIAFPDIDSPLEQAAYRMLDVFIGTVVAIGVNVFRLPRRKNKNLVFFVKSRDLVPDRFSHIPSAALFRLNYLYNDGARICLMSEHAPAFFTLQMSAAKLNVPLIVMDGAAIYDAVENRYLRTETIEPEDSARLRERLDELGLSYFIYTVHKNKTCIFHHGEYTGAEMTILDRMRRSPYRSYLEGEIYEPEEIVYFKIIAADDELADIMYSLRTALPKGRVRGVRRPQAGAPGISGLYIYAHTATMEQAQKRLMKMLREADPALEPVTITSPGGYRSERDAIQILHRLQNRYEPVALFARRKNRHKEETA